MRPEIAQELPDALRAALGTRWTVCVDGPRMTVRHQDAGTPYRPPKRTPDWADLMSRLESGFASLGVPRAPALPLGWRRETDLTISAIQALDPYLKHRQPFTFRTGYLPQPVVRFTGRDEHGQLRPGYLTSFVNVSRVEPIKGIHDYATIFDEWLGVLSRIGLHARHIELYGDLNVWRRPPVEGVTMRYRHDGVLLGDLVLLWNADDPTHLAVDLGTGLERLRWIISDCSWPATVFGSWAELAPVEQLDAIRTAVLLTGSGIEPSARGPGYAIRSILRAVPRHLATFGLSRAVRATHRYWSLAAPDLRPWPTITRVLEREVLQRA